jgi:hypothetical protein
MITEDVCRYVCHATVQGGWVLAFGLCFLHVKKLRSYCFVIRASFTSMSSLFEDD